MMKLPIFDLHVHTNLSDGSHTPDCIYDLMLGINGIWTVTDHDTGEFHNQYSASLVGSEISTYVDTPIGVLCIHVLVYDLPQEALHKLAPIVSCHDYQRILLNKLKSTLSRLGCIFDPDISINNGEFAHVVMWESLVQYTNNYIILGDSIMDADTFYRDSQVPDSKLYSNIPFCSHSLEDIWGVVNEYKGKLILAHPYWYHPRITRALLDCTLNNIHGIECLHPSASEEQSRYLLGLCDNHGLLASGGSDYHKGIYQGVPNFHLISEYPDLFEWIYEYPVKNV